MNALALSKISTKNKVVFAVILFLLVVSCISQVIGVYTLDVFAANNNNNGIFDIVDTTGKHTSGAGGINDSDGTESIATIIAKYKTIATAIMGILTITMLIFMLVQFTKLGAAGDNEVQRKKAIMGILTTGIATGLLGGATIVVGFFWNVFRGE